MMSTETYEQFVSEFPPVWPEDHIWVNVHDGQGPNAPVLSELIRRHIKGSSAVILVHAEPGLGAEVPLSDVANLIAPYILKYEVQVADSGFRSFVAITRSGVATGW